MTVFVDDMYLYPMGQFRRMKMSHMIAYSDDELHDMAARIGLRREWFQSDHYDVSMTCRARAIKLGAVPIALRTLAAMSSLMRMGWATPDPATAEILRYQCHLPRSLGKDVP